MCRFGWGRQEKTPMPGMQLFILLPQSWESVIICGRGKRWTVPIRLVLSESLRDIRRFSGIWIKVPILDMKKPDKS